jgi:hypothetical protein
MKKVVRMLGLCALIALAFTSCKKKETNSTLTFKATINQPTSDSRTHINEANLLAWDENDNILVFDNAGVNYDFTVGTIGEINDYADYQGVFEIPAGEKAEFMKDLDKSGKYWAYYPNASFENNNVKLQVPNTQVFVEEGSIMPNVYPMFATNNLDNFPFLSDAGILRIKLRKNSLYEPDVIVTKLVLKAQDDDLAGEMFYPYNNPSGYTKGTTYDEITLNCVDPETGDGVQVMPGNYDTNFNFVVLGGALTGAFTVEIYTTDSEDNPFEILSAAAQTQYNHSIEAMKITSMLTKTIPSAVPAK